MELVTKEFFQEKVEQWQRKGHPNVVAIEFSTKEEGGYMALIVPDYIEPEKVYYILVGDDEE